jgi:hypothetical protein
MVIESSLTMAAHLTGILNVDFNFQLSSLKIAIERNIQSLVRKELVKLEIRFLLNGPLSHL